MAPQSAQKLDSGTPGLDEVLHGGVLSGSTTVVSGGPGSGKTILALQFLAAGENALYIGFEERESQLRRNAAALGIDLSDVSVLDLSASGDRFFAGETYTVFPTEEVEGEQLLERTVAALESDDVDRLVVDPLSELRTLLPDDYQFRRNVSSLFNALADRGVTTLCTAQPSDPQTERDLQFLGNAAVELHRHSDHRTLEVTKSRGSEYAEGDHTFRIHAGTGGRVYPKLVPGDYYREYERTTLRSDVDALDALLGGGIERGSVTVVSGPSGVGKTTTASQFLQAAADRGDRALAYLFEELRPDYLTRSAQLGMHLRELVDAGRLELEEVEALTQTPDEIAFHVRQAVEDRDVEFVVLDGIVGYRQGLRGEHSPEALTRELHALCRYLKRMGVTTILVEEVRPVTGEFSPSSHNVSYLADNIVFLRYVEVGGSLQKTIGVLKKRYSGFEEALHGLSIDADGLHVGDALTDYQGVLTGVATSTRRE